MTEIYDLPPHDIEAEEAVVASCLVDPRAIPECLAVVRPEMFFRESNGAIFGAILDVWTRGEDAIQVTVAHELSKRPGSHPDASMFDEIGGQTYMSAMIRRLPTSIGSRFYAEIVARCWRQRRLVSLGERLRIAASDASADPAMVSEQAVEWLLREGVERSRVLTRSVGDVLRGTAEKRGTPEDDGLAIRIDEFLASPGDIRGIPTGWDELDFMISGLQRTQTYTIVADTSVGKSAFLQWALLNIALGGTPVLLITTEMSADEVTERLVYMLAGVDPVEIRQRGEPTAEECTAIYAAESELTDLPLYITDVGGISLQTILAESRRQRQLHGIEVVAIDHLQHITVEGLTGAQRMEAVTLGTKSLAMNLDVPVVQISHINRAAANAGIIGLHSAKNSSSIEQDTNVFITLVPVRFDVNTWTVMTEQEADQFRAKHNYIHVRASVNKNRAGMKSQSVRRFDWRVGGRFEPIGQPRREDDSESVA